MPLPTMPTIEPLPLSKNERLSGKGPSLVRRIKHIWRQAVPNPRFVWKWCTLGAFASAAFLALGILVTAASMSQADEKARTWRAERTAEIKRKADIEQAKQAHENEFKAITARAVANWETWRSQFTTETDGIVCAHGSNTERTNYEISCQVGPKGKLPTSLIVCNQGSCRPPQPIPAPAPAPEKK